MTPLEIIHDRSTPKPKVVSNRGNNFATERSHCFSSGPPPFWLIKINYFLHIERFLVFKQKKRSTNCVRFYKCHL